MWVAFKPSANISRWSHTNTLSLSFSHTHKHSLHHTRKYSLKLTQNVFIFMQSNVYLRKAFSLRAEPWKSILCSLDKSHSNNTSHSKAGMRKIRPAGQMWPVQAFNRARKTPNFVYLACFFDKNTLWMCYNQLTLALGYVKKNLWPAMRFELCTHALRQRCTTQISWWANKFFLTHPRAKVVMF